MKRIRFLLLIAVVFSNSIAQVPGPVQIANANDSAPFANNHLIMSVVWYQRSAEMRAVFYQTYLLATLMLDKNIASMDQREKPAIVLDIDETILDNSPFEVFCIESGESYTPENWKKWTDQASALALPGALDFLKYANSKGVEIFYISNRTKDEMKTTIENLIAIGFPFADESHVLLKTDKSDKTLRRKTVDEKYEIVLFLGDNLSDFDEMYSKRGEDYGYKLVDENRGDIGTRFIILPNPMYGDWEKNIYRNLNKPSQNEKLKALRKSLREN